ncbi:hypothetical protein [Actinophytocola sp. KF-1]
MTPRGTVAYRRFDRTGLAAAPPHSMTFESGYTIETFIELPSPKIVSRALRPGPFRTAI